MTPAELTVLEGLEKACCGTPGPYFSDYIVALRRSASSLFAALREAWKRAEQFRDSRGYHVLTSDEWAAAQGDKADAERLTYLRFYIDLCSLPNESPEADAVRDKMDRFRSGVYGCLRDAMGKVCAAFDDAELFRRIERDTSQVARMARHPLDRQWGVWAKADNPSRVLDGPVFADDLRSALAALPEAKP